MRILISLIMVCLAVISLQAKSYIYVDNGIKLFLKNQKVTLYAGTPVDVLSKNNGYWKVKIIGYSNKDQTVLYATKNFKLILAKVENSGLIKKNGNKSFLIVNVPTKYITNDMDEAWEYGSDLFYDKCTRCHHAKIIENHTMREWSVLYNSMKYKAQTTKDEDRKILRFLRAFAKDGILKESD